MVSVTDPRYAPTVALSASPSPVVASNSSAARARMCRAASSSPEGLMCTTELLRSAGLGRRSALPARSSLSTSAVTVPELIERRLPSCVGVSPSPPARCRITAANVVTLAGHAVRFRLVDAGGTGEALIGAALLLLGSLLASAVVLAGKGGPPQGYLSYGATVLWALVSVVVNR